MSTSVSAAILMPDTDDDYLCVAVASANSPSRVSSTYYSMTLTKLKHSLIPDVPIKASIVERYSMCKILNLKITSLRSIIRMASASLSAQSKSYCTVSLKLGDETYEKVTLHVLDGLCIDIILGTDFQEQQESVRIAYGVSKPPISFAALTTMNTDSPPLFVILTADCKPIAAKSRNNTKADQDFIRSEVKRLAEAGIIKPIHSPWRAQVLLIMRNSSVEWLWTNLRQ